MDQQKALDKILKCLARAQGTDSQHEAETALRQARALMDKYHVGQGDVLAAGVAEHQVRCGTKSKPTTWMHRLANVCADAFGCNVVAYGFCARGWYFRFYGIGVSSQLSSYAYSMLHHQLIKARKAFVCTQSRCKLATKRRRGDLFAQGWIDAVSLKVRQFAGTDESTAAALLAYKTKHFPDAITTGLLRVEAQRVHDAKASSHGWAEGRNAQLHRGVARAQQPTLGGA
ncbi:hypothetical protein BVH03_17565 [Pseudomonas sp. PA15(2017)]|uniref:DUF2786 domain-containing protein n=1 Tax=Pseudomonas sp. PA15(2017) TaxID=1932111 RepID=UPI0009617513|nr:DUF2786 domain-containing protein [Pseudomonas sp. PA15(2017)]OLU25464.1 hypothetical protein BVH03_17565 [Pseudomonas sp. PA15(2017)]